MRIQLYLLNVLTSTPGVLNLLVLAHPQIKNSTQISFIWVRFFEFCIPLWALCVPPVASSCTPRGTGTPGWEPLIYTIALCQLEFGKLVQQLHCTNRDKKYCCTFHMYQSHNGNIGKLALENRLNNILCLLGDKWLDQSQVTVKKFLYNTIKQTIPAKCV